MKPLAAPPDLAPAAPGTDSDGLSDALDQVTQLNERMLALVRERPLTCLAAAVTLGFVIGKIAARY